MDDDDIPVVIMAYMSYLLFHTDIFDDSSPRSSRRLDFTDTNERNKKRKNKDRDLDIEICDSLRSIASTYASKKSKTNADILNDSCPKSSDLTDTNEGNKKRKILDRDLEIKVYDNLLSIALAFASKKSKTNASKKSKNVDDKEPAVVKAKERLEFIKDDITQIKNDMENNLADLFKLLKKD